MKRIFTVITLTLALLFVAGCATDCSSCRNGMCNSGGK